MKTIIKKIQKNVLSSEMADFNWGEGVALWGINRSIRCCENNEYIPFLKHWIDNGIVKNGIIRSINTSIPMVSVGKIYINIGERKYLDMLVEHAQWLMNEAPRLDNGAFIHSDPYVGLLGRQIWADTVFMAGLFLAYVGNLTDHKKYIIEAENQLVLHADMLRNDDGLFYHGYDDNKKSFIGCKWGRANAWISVAIVEMLDYLPVNDKLVPILEEQLNSASKYQRENGLWRTVLDGAMSYDEASCAYGFGYAILKGIRLGILDKKYMEIVDKMSETLINNVDENGGVMNISAGTPVMRNELEYNIICQHRVQPWGQGLALMYFSEFEEYNTSKNGGVRI